MCAGEYCDLPACADAAACQDYQRQKRSTANILVARQFGCPPGLDCGHGPVCAGEFCDLPACAGSTLCPGSQDRKRSTANTLVDRQFECPTGLDCGPGPVCTAGFCHLPGCADAEVCQGNQAQKRSAETDIVHPTCDICIVGPNGLPICGCATPDKGPHPRGTEKVCPLFCIHTDDDEILCGCAAEDYENSLKGSPPTA